ncbi:polysaccharide pyruvyl transferase family protein [Enterobacteriaceae bacterium]
MTHLIFGYYDLNFGDDWLIKQYVNRYKVPQAILVLSDPILFKPFEADKRYKYVGGIGKRQSFLQSDQVDIVGGSMFQAGERWFRHYLKLFITIKLAKLLKKKVTIVGCNLDEPPTWLFGFLLKSIFKNVDYFRVRDAKSYRILNQKYGVSKINVELALDLADDALPHKSSTDEQSCSVSIINNKKVNKGEYFTWLLLQVESMHENNKVTNFELFGFDSGKESDESAIDDFLRYFTSSSKYVGRINISKYIYNGDIVSFIEEWRGNHFAICTRFHSYILARNSKQDFRIYNYSSKIKEYILTHHEHEVMNLNAS